MLQTKDQLSALIFKEIFRSCGDIDFVFESCEN